MNFQIIMQDVLIGIHSHSSVTANTLAQLVEKVTTSYSTVGGRGEGTCSDML